MGSRAVCKGGGCGDSFAPCVSGLTPSASSAHVTRSKKELPAEADARSELLWSQSLVLCRRGGWWKRGCAWERTRVLRKGVTENGRFANERLLYLRFPTQSIERGNHPTPVRLWLRFCFRFCHPYTMKLLRNTTAVDWQYLRCWTACTCLIWAPVQAETVLCYRSWLEKVGVYWELIWQKNRFVILSEFFQLNRSYRLALQQSILNTTQRRLDTLHLMWSSRKDI